MQSPIILFDHIKKVAATIAVGPGADKRLAEVLAPQRKQIGTSGRPSH